MGLHTAFNDDLKEVDVIIAGGGTSGCVIAGRLAEADPGLSILLIEGGKNNEMPTVSVPALFLSHMLPDSKTNIFYKARKSKQVADRELDVLAGGVLGGGSSTNYMMYSRAQRSDLDSWNTPGWSADDLIPYMQKLETYHGHGPKEVHGYDGPIHVSKGTHYATRFQNDFIAAANKRGLPEVEDLQRMDMNDCVTRALRYISPDGVRSDAASAYVHPKLKAGTHPKLHVLLESQVIQVLFDQDKRATGVELRSNPLFHDEITINTVKARRLVVLTAGAISSPSILERSGVGEAKVLQRLAIPVVADVPGVGHGYQDHHLIMYTYKAALEPDESWDGFISGRLNVDQMIKDKHPMLGSNAQDVGIRIRPSDQDVATLGPAFQKMWDGHFRDVPDRSLACMSAIPGLADQRKGSGGQYMSLSCFTVHPMSRGYVHITGPGIDDPIDFDTGYFAGAGNLDLKKQVWLYKKQREIFRRMQLFRGELASTHPPFPPGSKSACKDYTGPLPEDVEDIEYSAEDDMIIEQFVRENVGTTWHSLGTCKMAPREDMGAVNASLSVHGVRGLKVADLSIAPGNVGANTNNLALTVGEKAADIFIKELGLKR